MVRFMTHTDTIYPEQNYTVVLNSINYGLTAYLSTSQFDEQLTMQDHLGLLLPAIAEKPSTLSVLNLHGSPMDAIKRLNDSMRTLLQDEKPVDMAALNVQQTDYIGFIQPATAKYLCLANNALVLLSANGQLFDQQDKSVTAIELQDIFNQQKIDLENTKNLGMCTQIAYRMC